MGRLAKGVAAGKKAFSLFDFLLRLAFFLAVPRAIAILAGIFPIYGIVINVGVALVVFYVAHRVRAIPILSRVLGRALRFEAYYREHAPKPFLYYVFFPFLFPYWLIVDRARREVNVYRPFSGVPAVVLVGVNAWQYFARYRPEIPFKLFAIAAGTKLLVELVIVMCFLMPVATSVITYEQQKKPWHLRALAGAFVVSLAFTVGWHFAYPRLVAPLEVQYRALWRTQYAGRRAHDALVAASTLALDDVVEDGQIPEELVDEWIEGEVLDETQARLEAFYKTDEARGFRLTVVRYGGRLQSRALLLFQARSGQSLPRVWIALDRFGRQLPDDAISDRELVGAQLGEIPKTRVKKKRHGQRPRRAPPPESVDETELEAPPPTDSAPPSPTGSAPAGSAAPPPAPTEPAPTGRAPTPTSAPSAE